MFCSHKRKCNKKIRNRRSTTRGISSRNKQSAIQEHIPSGSDRTTISVCSVDDNAWPQEQNSVTDLVAKGTTMSTCSVEEDVEGPSEQTSCTDFVTNAPDYTNTVMLPTSIREYNVGEQVSKCFY